MVLQPWSQHSVGGGDDPRRLKLGLIGWQAGEPFLDEPFTERPRLVTTDSEFHSLHHPLSLG